MKTSFVFFFCMLTNELTEESDQFRILRTSCFTNLEGSIGLIWTKASGIRISVPLDLSSHPFIPLPRFIRSRRPTPCVVPSLVLFPPRSTQVEHAEGLFECFIDSSVRHSFRVTFSFPWSSTFFILLKINKTREIV